MTVYNFRFGKCTSPTFGAVTLDMFDLPLVQAFMQSSETLIGGSSRASDGMKRQDRWALKREWPAMALGHYMPLDSWWPVKRLWRAGGPWLFYDHTVPNYLSNDQRLMQNSSWVNGSSVAYTPRADGAVAVPAAALAQLASYAAAPPVVVGQRYSCGVTVRGTGAWTATVSIIWYTAGGGVISASSSSLFSAATALGNPLILDGSVTGSRIAVLNALAPATAAFGVPAIQLGAGATADVSDPVMVRDSADPGPAMTVVQLNDIPATYGSPIMAGLVLNMSEV